MISQGYNLRFISLKDFVPGPGTLCPTTHMGLTVPAPGTNTKRHEKMKLSIVRTDKKNISHLTRQEKHFPLDG